MKEVTLAWRKVNKFVLTEIKIEEILLIKIGMDSLHFVQNYQKRSFYCHEAF